MQHYNYYYISDIFCQNRSVTTENLTSLSFSGVKCMIKKFNSATSLVPDPSTVTNCHTFLDLYLFERDVLYGQLYTIIEISQSILVITGKSFILNHLCEYVSVRHE